MRTLHLITTLLFIAFGSIDTVAQSPFSTQSHIFHLGFGFGDKDEFPANATPSLGISYEQGAIDNLGIGNLGLGGLLGVKYFYGDDLSSNLTRMLVAGKATYHFNFVNSYKFDFYLGALGGMYFWLTDATEISNSKTDFDFGAYAGIRYFFSDRFGVYLEAGYGLGFLNGGVAVNF